MASFSRLSFVGLVVAALFSLVSAQCDTTAVDRCTEVYMTDPTIGITFNAVLTYDATFQICAITVGTISSTNANAQNPAGYSLSLASRTASGQNMISQVPGSIDLLAVNLQFTATPSAGSPGSTTPLPGSIVSSNVAVQSQLTLNAQGFTGPSGVATGPISSNVCTNILGDPLFRGFKGQQFYIGGEDGQVMNMLSTFNMQLNGRFVSLEEGAAITPAEQEKIRVQSEIRHSSEPSVATFPKTLAWTHPGNYFGEMGVALLDDNRVYAKAGPFQTGFAKLALNGRQLPVSDDFVVLGQGVNTTYIQRVSAHELMVRTVNVEFTLTNSDNFLNVEHIHLEKGFRQHNRFTGLLGNTVDEKWTWNKKDEEAAIVQSNDLFAKEQ